MNNQKWIAKKGNEKTLPNSPAQHAATNKNQVFPMVEILKLMLYVWCEMHHACLFTYAMCSI